jgi:hypothetical protein
MITPQERRIVRDLAVIYGTYGIIWGSVYMATDWGSVPQWITASVAFGALIIAGVGIWMQRHVARQRAAIDFFIRTEMDRHLVEAYDNFWKGINEMGKMKVSEFYSSKEGPVRDHYFNVRKYLNIHELIAVGIKNKTLDERICFGFWCDVLLRGVNAAQPLIDHVRKQPNHDETYTDLMGLYATWKLMAERLKRRPSGSLITAAGQKS